MTEDVRATLDRSTEKEKTARKQFHELFARCPIPSNEILGNLGLFMNRQTVSRLLFMHELYQKILNVHGVVMEFGTRWGHNLALFHSFRGIYEPYNYNRKIIAFDTFEGFPSVDAKDGGSSAVSQGAYNVTERYEEYLEQVLAYHVQESPLAHLRRHELVKGDVTKTVPKYLEQHPETMVALAYFDLDLYEPTKRCLELLRPHLTKGTVLAFDELNHSEWPGETIALKEVFGLANCRLQRSPANPTPSYMVIE